MGFVSSGYLNSKIDFDKYDNIKKYSNDDWYKVYALDLDKVNSIEDCKKILNFLCKTVLKPHPIDWSYNGFEDVEEYFK